VAIKKIQIRPEGNNDYADVLHPETSVDMVVGLDRYGVASGTNTYTVTIPNTPALTTGLRVTVKFTNANTGAATLNINGLGAKSIVKAGGAALKSGNIKANGVYTLVYDGSVFQLQGEGGEYGTAQASDVLSGKTIGTENGIVTGTMPNRGAVTHTITTQGGSYTIPAGYHNGSGKVTASFANLVAGNVKSGVNIGGVAGTLLPFNSATGTVTISDRFNSYSFYKVGNSTISAHSVEVSGLSFTPKVIILQENFYGIASTTIYHAYPNSSPGSWGGLDRKLYWFESGSSGFESGRTATPINFRVSSTPNSSSPKFAYVTQDSFCLPFPIINDDNYYPTQVRWIAVG